MDDSLFSKKWLQGLSRSCLRVTRSENVPDIPWWILIKQTSGITLGLQLVTFTLPHLNKKIKWLFVNMWHIISSNLTRLLLSPRPWAYFVLNHGSFSIDASMSMHLSVFTYLFLIYFFLFCFFKGGVGH